MTGPATAWAAAWRPGTPMRWKALETAAWSGHPGVARALAGRVSLGMGLFAAGAFILYLVAFAYPIVALGLSTPGRGGAPWADASTRLTTVGVVVAVGLVAHVVLVGLWLAHRPLERTRTLSRQSTVVLAAGALLVVSVLSLRADAGGGGWVLLLVVVPVVLSATTLVLHRTMARPPTASAEVTPRAVVRQAVARVPEVEQDAVRADLEQALDLLLAADAISLKERQKVAGAPLGMLTVALSAPRTRS